MAVSSRVSATRQVTLFRCHRPAARPARQSHGRITAVRLRGQDNSHITTFA